MERIKEIDPEPKLGFSRYFANLLEAGFFVDICRDYLSTSQDSISDSVGLIKRSSQNGFLEENQIRALNSLSGSATLISVSVKPSFLGGTLASYHKIISAIAIARLLRSEGSESIPLVWIDDDVVDNLDSSVIFLASRDGFLTKISSDASLSKADRTVLSERKYTREAVKRWASAANLIRSKKFSASENIYREGNSWSNAFAEFASFAFGESGVLIAKVSQARKSGLFLDLVSKEIRFRGKSEELIRAEFEKAKGKGAFIKSKSREINLRAIDGEGKLNDDIKGAEPNALTPNAALKAVFQERVLPSSLRVVSPSEAVYLSTIPRVFDWFAADFPPMIPRFSAVYAENLARKGEPTAENPTLGDGDFQERIVAGASFFFRESFELSKIFEIYPKVYDKISVFSID